jgi:hypothetical protein
MGFCQFFKFMTILVSLKLRKCLLQKFITAIMVGSNLRVGCNFFAQKQRYFEKGLPAGRPFLLEIK